VMDLTCREATYLIGDYLDATLATRPLERLEHHILICQGCTAFLANYALVATVLGSIRLRSVPNDLGSRIVGLADA